MKKVKKIRRCYLLKESTIKKLEKMAEKQNRKLSAIIEILVDGAKN